MKQTVALLACLLLLIACFAQQSFQLAPPLMKYTSVFFEKKAAVQLQFRQAAAVIRYTLDNTEPNGKSHLYTKPLMIAAHKTTLKARSFSKNYLTSATVAATFMQAGITIAKAEGTPPNEKYKGGGITALTDNEGGNPSVSAKTWLGFQADTIAVELTLQQTQNIKEIAIDFLQSEGGWIFMPEAILAYTFDEATNTWQAFDQRKFSFESAVAGSNCVFTGLTSLQPKKAMRLLLKIVPLQSLPQWHDGKGKPAWVFIDEIKVY